MAYYLDGPTLAGAVERLGASRAKPSLCDFLIVKHAMTQGDGTVTLSLVDETYMNAVRVMTAVSGAVDGKPLPPYFNPFGTKREGRRGWRTEKYPSNGPPDTVNGPKWKRVIEVLSEGPRRVRFTDDYLDHLAPVIVRSPGPSRSGGPTPQLEDCALWFHRAWSIRREEALTEVSVDKLVATFVEATGLTDDERRLIFEEA